MSEKTLQEYIQKLFELRVEEAVENEEVECKKSYEAYGDTYACACEFIEDSDMDDLKDRFIEETKEDEDLIVEILEENGYKDTNENRDLLFKVLEEL